MNSATGWTRVWLMLAVGVMCVAFAISMSAQVKTATETTSGQASHQMTVERGEVVVVQGNPTLVVSAERLLLAL